MKYKEIDDYDHQELIDWYKEGFKSNQIAVQIKETAFENGYTNSDYFIPEEFKINDESIALYDSLFEEGQALRAQEKQKENDVYFWNFDTSGRHFYWWVFSEKEKKETACLIVNQIGIKLF